jgi:hypothetical protein
MPRLSAQLMSFGFERSEADLSGLRHHGRTIHRIIT